MPSWWCKEVREWMDAKIEPATKLWEEAGKEDGTFQGCDFRVNEKRIDTSIQMEKFGSIEERRQELLLQIEICLLEYYNHCAADYTGTKFHIQHTIEELQCKMQRTPPGGGFTVMHYEQGRDYHTSRRFAVWMLYLNDVTKGGKTDFPNQDLSVTPKEGTMVIWPAAYTHPHRSAPDLDQWKYIITGWFVYKDRDDTKNTIPYEKNRT